MIGLDDEDPDVDDQAIDWGSVVFRWRVSVGVAIDPPWLHLVVRAARAWGSFQVKKDRHGVADIFVSPNSAHGWRRVVERLAADPEAVAALDATYRLGGVVAIEPILQPMLTEALNAKG